MSEKKRTSTGSRKGSPNRDVRKDSVSLVRPVPPRPNRTKPSSSKPKPSANKPKPSSRS